MRSRGRSILVYLTVFALGVGAGVSGPAYAAIRQSKIASVSDDVNTAKIQPSDLNPMTEPMTPVQNDIWIDVHGASPTRSLALKVYDGGAWHTMASISY